ncbi:response regulator receiver modulated diguanylate cyclase [Pseudoduganella namucuonensis]|uniref:diguanylate cyclase n=2 Tax=Pseudoduganella namucuonensis TaxID=1035707 RepID=A0A1I7H1Y8_9BURK|nr:response regulator receiver modulated diguanylate cyclase [Pseudoduganella namucuonensis]
MPGIDGIDLCRAIRTNRKDSYTYLIMLTSRSETEFAVEAMNAGADDFIGKPFHPGELEARVRAGKRICELEQLLRQKAIYDALTGIYNRGAIIDILDKAVARQQRDHGGLTLAFADLDHFKQVNDVHGHTAGDIVLREVARRMGQVLRPYDSLGRYGGEELMVVLPGCEANSALEIAERIRKNVCAEPIATDFGAIHASVSIGLAVLSEGMRSTYGDLIQLADRALYVAKNEGRNRVFLAA